MATEWELTLLLWAPVLYVGFMVWLEFKRDDMARDQQEQIAREHEALAKHLDERKKREARADG